MTTLTHLHLSELHERARELGVPDYRKLSREELVEAIGEEQPEPEAPRREGDRREDAAPERRPSGRTRDRRRRRRERSQGSRDERERDREREADEELDDDGPDSGAEADTEMVSGVLDRTSQGHGFLRLEGLHAAEGDVYVSASQIRRCELRSGDEIAGPARSPRRGERHRALVRVETVNGVDPEAERPEFEDLTPVTPKRRLPIGDGDDVLARAVDLLGPLAHGQRVLVLAEPRSGRTTLMRSLAVAAAGVGARVVILLADERPEEVTEWRKALPEAEIVAAPADQEPAEQARAADLAIGHAKRRAEAGEDVVVLIDSLSRLALGYRDPAQVKRLFGAGRELDEEGAGSLTVVATVLASDKAGERVQEALETTENLLLRLDPDLAAKGIVPALSAQGPSPAGEQELREPDELAQARKLRAELAELEPEEAAKRLGELISDSRSNAELLEKVGD